MPKFNLVPYSPDESLLLNFEAEINLAPDNLFISYRINRNNDKVDFGSITPNRERKIRLWEKTCFELFIKNEDNQYLEFNFAPNLEWNVFFFNKKGDPLKEYEQMTMPIPDILHSKNHFLMIQNIDLRKFPKNFLQKDKIISIGITSVILDEKNKLSYWALSHEDTRPNFHHFDSFKYKFLWQW